MISASNADWPTQQLAEFVAQISSIKQESEAIGGAVERAAEALEAEIGLIVIGGSVITQVGLAEGEPVQEALAAFRDPTGGPLQIEGLGVCYAVASPLSGEQDGWMILARTGEEGFDAEERNLLRGMARVTMMVVEMIRSAAALRESERGTLEILETASDAFVSIDPGGKIIAWNRRAEVIFGRPREEVVGKRLVDEIIPESYRQAHLEGFARLAATGKSKILGKRLELSALRADGSEFPVELTVWAAGASSGASFNAFIRDISERKKAEELVALLAAIVESTDDSVIAYSLSGEIKSWNAGAERLYGYSGKEVVGQSYEVIVPLQERGRAAENLSIVATGRSVHNLETRRLRKDGREVDVAITISPIQDPAGRVIGMSSIGRDITRRKQAERILKRAFEHEREMVQKLRQVDEIKSNFVSSVSHELRTPLTSIVGYLELLLEESSAFSDSQQEILGVIDRNSRRLLTLIEDVLTLSRIESGKFEISPAPLNLSALVDDVTTAVIPMMTARSLDLQVDLDGVNELVADGSQLERVLFNLLTNAIKFTPDGGTIKVSARLSDGTAAISVADTGLGIAPEEQAKLFDYFYRSSTAQAMAIPGTGLGLAIVKNIVEKHGGKVSVESELGAGTTATFTIPVDGPVAKPASKEQNGVEASKEVI